MGEVINLRRARKGKAREAASVQAAANRALHGRTAAEKARDAQEKARIDRAVDGARLDEPDPE